MNYYFHSRGETHFTLGEPKDHEFLFLMLCKINSQTLSTSIHKSKIQLSYCSIKFHLNKRGEKINKNIGQTKPHNTVWVLLAH